MTTLPPDSYRPSEVLIRLLYSHLIVRLPAQVQSQVDELTCDEIRHSFAYSLSSIRDWDACKNICESVFWVVDTDEGMRQEFLKEVKNRMDLHYTAEFDNPDFKMRFAEEVMHWSLRWPEAAATHGLVWDVRDGRHCLSLVRKVREVDLTGFA